MDLNLVLAFQSIPGLAGIMRALSLLGTAEFFLLVMPILYWCVDANLGARMAVVLVATNGLTDLARLFFRLPRPYWTDRRVQALSTEPSYGMPSGHSSTAAALWGYLAVQLKRAWVWAVLLVLIALIGLSRIYLGVHFPSQVVVGFALGAAVAWAMVAYETRARAWFGGLGLGAQIGIAVGLSLVYVALALLAQAVLPVPPELATWTSNAAAAAPTADPITPNSLEAIAQNAGIIAGLGIALALAARHARFDARGPLPARVARFVTGVIGVLILWRGLALVFPSDQSALALALRYVRYGLVLLWVIYAAPWVFLRAKLAEVES
jgi:membrane-associated phospholipid phosphatase